MRDLQETPTSKSKESKPAFRTPTSESTSLGGTHHSFSAEAPFQAHASSRGSRPRSRGAAEKPEPQTLRSPRTPSRRSRRLLLKFPALRPHSALSAESPSRGPVVLRAFRLAERTMGPGSCPCPARAALPVPLGPPLARVPCPSPFPEPRGAGAPGCAGY